MGVNINPALFNVGIIGSGRMGTDLFYYLSEFGFALTWSCRTAGERERLARTWTSRIERQRRAGILDDGAVRSKNKSIAITDGLSGLSHCGIVIEAIAEDREAKRGLLAKLGSILGPGAVVATATSSLKPSILAGDLPWRDRFCAVHFFYPVKYRDIVEVVTADWTGADTLETVKMFLSAIKRSFIVMHERDGFILNRILLDFQAQACRLRGERGLDVRTIDSIVKGAIVPAGVFEFFDAVGIDIMYRSVLNYVEDMPDRRFYEPLIEDLERLAGAGRLGRKSGAGFYNYGAGLPAGGAGSVGDSAGVSDQLRALYINAAFRALERNICPQCELERAITEYLGVDRGPFAMAEAAGRPAIRSLLEKYYAETGFGPYRPSPLL